MKAKIQCGAVIYAKDMLRIAEFYKNVAELIICDTNKTHIKLEKESFQLVVLQVSERISESIEINEPPLRRENTPIKLVFFVESIRKIRQIIMSFGGELNGTDREWEFDGCIVCDGQDPEGNVFQLRTPMRL